MFYLFVGSGCWKESATTYGCPQLALEKQLFGIKYSGCEHLARGILGRHLCGGRNSERRKDEQLEEVSLWFRLV